MQNGSLGTLVQNSMHQRPALLMSLFGWLTNRTLSLFGVKSIYLSIGYVSPGSMRTYHLDIGKPFALTGCHNVGIARDARMSMILKRKFTFYGKLFFVGDGNAEIAGVHLRSDVRDESPDVKVKGIRITLRQLPEQPCVAKREPR
jgi:hypothetical protein